MNGDLMLTAKLYRALLILLMSALFLPANAQNVPLGTTPPPESLPKAEFVFEERVTLSPAVVLGETPLGHRQYIPITGGKIAGPKLNGEVIPGGWDFQLRYASGCGTLSADYFLRADDGTVIHILNEGFNCGFGEPNGERSYMHPRFEAPKGKYDWLTKGTFVATLELDIPLPPKGDGKSTPNDQPVAPPAGPPRLDAIRIKFYQIK